MNRNRGLPRAGGVKADRSSSHALPMNDHHRFTDSDLSSDNDGQPIEVHRVPEDQLQLSPEQQNEVFTKIINAVDPNISKAGVRFDYVEGTFKPRPTVSNLAVHFEMEGIMLHLDSEEAKEQLVWMENNKDRIQDFRIASSSGGGDEEPMSPSRGGGGGADVGGVEEEEEVERDAPAQPVNDRALKNQFNYSERASQTNNPALRDREVCTEPPPCVDYAGQVTRWEIVDTYIEELEKQVAQRKEKEKPERKKVQDDDDDRPAAPGGALSSSSATVPAPFAQQLNAIFHSPACVAAIKTMERLVNQTADAATFFDYKYFEESHDAAHAADKNKALEKERRGIHSLGPPVHGTFLPLWRFSHEGVKKRTVTSLCFNPDHPDLFAAGFGSYEFGRSVRGMICLYSLKNATYPECAFETPSGVMSLDFHPQHAALIAVGMYDGTVAVYDVRDKSGVPLYISEDPKVKHTDPVWQVHWCTDEDAAGAASSEGKKGLNFFSVSSDGRITNWCMNKNELQHEEVVQLRLVGGVHGEGGAGGAGAAGAAGGAGAGAGAADDAASAAAASAAAAATSSDPDSTIPVDATATTSNNANVTSLVGLAGGSCFDFNVHNRHLFIVGTEEGAIHLYSKAYNSQFVRAYVGHDMSVYAVKWNPFHPGIFLSCSADWQVKVWEVETPTPIMTFDLGCSVGDIAWSPYSSTSFSVVTSDGKLRAYDLSLHKHEPIGELKVNKKTKLTHVCYNSVEPILCVGDDRGAVTVVKLSSTLRKMGAPTIAEIDKEEEVQRLDRLLIIPTRAAEGTAQPAYLTSFLDTFRREKELVAKAKAAEKAATEASKAGAQSPLASPKGRKD